MSNMLSIKALIFHRKNINTTIKYAKRAIAQIKQILLKENITTATIHNFNSASTITN